MAQNMKIDLPARIQWRERNEGEDLRTYAKDVEYPARFWDLATHIAKQDDEQVKSWLASYGARYGETGRLKMREAVIHVRAELEGPSSTYARRIKNA